MTERVALVICPFRAYLHLPTTTRSGVAALRAAHDLLLPGGRLVFDVFAPSPDDIEETHGRWLEREPGIWERADWDDGDAAPDARRARATQRRRRMTLAWLSPPSGATLLEQSRLRGRGLLRLVRPPPVHRRRGLGLARAATVTV